MQFMKNPAQAAHFFLVILFAAGFSGCSEDPNPVGAGLLPSSDLLKLDTLSTFAIRSSGQSAIPLASTTRLLVGKVRDIESWGVFRFSSLPDSVAYMKILSAEVILRANYHFGDSLASFSFSVHKVLQSWGTDSLTVDSLTAAGFYDANPMSTINLPSVGDTASITIPVDTTLIRSWGTISDTTLQNFGILLRPTNSQVVKGFAMFGASDESHRPRLLMRFLREEFSRIDTLILSKGVSRFGARILDASWISDSARIYVHNGLSYRGVLEFDISSLPAHAAIHRAQLELTLDPSQSQFSSYTVDSTVAVYSTNDGVALTEIFGLSESFLSNGTRIHRYPVGQFVQRWVRGTTQRRIIIAGLGEPEGLDLFAFYGAAAPLSLRPRLSIVYSLIQ